MADISGNGSRIRSARVRLLLTQIELAKRAQINVATVVRAEQGASLSPLVQERIARALGVQRSELFPEPSEVAG